MGYYDNQTDKYKQNYYQLHYAHQFNNHLNVVSAAYLTTGKGYYESYKNDRKFSKYGLSDTPSPRNEKQLRSNVENHMLMLQGDEERVKKYFKDENLKYAA